MLYEVITFRIGSARSPSTTGFCFALTDCFKDSGDAAFSINECPAIPDIFAVMGITSRNHWLSESAGIAECFPVRSPQNVPAVEDLNRICCLKGFFHL